MAGFQFLTMRLGIENRTQTVNVLLSAQAGQGRRVFHIEKGKDAMLAYGGSTGSVIKGHTWDAH